MSLYSDLPKDLQEHIDNPTLFNLLSKLRFEGYKTIEEMFPVEFGEQTPGTRYLCIKYHGMGHYQLATVDTTRDDKKFYLHVVGGSNDWDRRDNKGKLSRDLKESNYCTLMELVLFAYGTDDAPIYVDLEDLKKNLDIIEFAEFVSIPTEYH